MSINSHSSTMCMKLTVWFLRVSEGGPTSPSSAMHSGKIDRREDCQCLITWHELLLLVCGQVFPQNHRLPDHHYCPDIVRPASPLLPLHSKANDSPLTLRRNK